MPELPEVELTRENLMRWTSGHAIASLEVNDSNLIEGLPLAELQHAFERGEWRDIRRRGKLLIWDFAEGKALGIHLRMTGKFILRESPEKTRKSRSTIALPNGQCIVFEDQRRFARWEWGSLLHVETELGWNRLGPDAWSAMPPATALHEKSQRTRRSIRDILLDQQFISGVGNIIANESLFLSGIHPLTPGKSLSRFRWEQLTKAIQETLETSLARDRGQEILYQGEKGANNPFLVYGKAGEPCPQCGTVITGGKKTGRSLFACLKCQPLSQAPLRATCNN